MKSIVEFINEAIVNEVSHGLAQRAYNKASGAQKNRIKKLYKEIYGKDVNENDVSHIQFNVPKDEQASIYGSTDESELAYCFTYLRQDIADKIKEVTLTSSDLHNDKYEITLDIDDKSYYAVFDWSAGNSGEDKYNELGCELTNTNIKSLKKEFDGNGDLLIHTFISYIIKDLEK